MNVSRNNFETYIIDYFDGRLNAIETAELMLFLEQNPDIRSEFDSFEEIKLSVPDHIVYAGKNVMKRSIIPEGTMITEDNYEEFFFEAVEGSLDKDKVTVLQHFLFANPALQRDYELLEKTRLQADAIVYPGKAQLKKAIIIPFYRRAIIATSVAAAIALLVIAGTYIFKGNTIKGTVAMVFMTGIRDRAFGKPANENIRTPQHEFRQTNAYIADIVQKDNKRKSANDLQKASNKEPLAVEPVFPGRQLACIPIKEHVVQTRIEKYQSTYTDVIACIEMRQRIKQENMQNENATANFTRKAMNRLHKAAGNDNDRPDSQGFTFWDVADIGVAGYNALAKKDLKLNRETDNQGRTTSFALGAIEYSRK